MQSNLFNNLIGCFHKVIEIYESPKMYTLPKNIFFHESKSNPNLTQT